MKEMLPTSKSSFKEITTCPEHWYWTHIKGISSPPGKPALIGLDTEKGWQAVGEGKSIEDAILLLKYDESIDLLYSAIPLTERLNCCTETVYQARVYLDATGYRCFDSRNAIALGILDCVQMTHEETLVQDLKTGQRYIDTFEVRLYAACGRALNPFVDNVRFQYIWAKTARVDEWKFDFSGENVKETSPDGETVEYPRWWEELRDKILALEELGYEPNPGDHCNSWYGSPCHVLDKCSAHKQTGSMIAVSNEIEVTGDLSQLLLALAGDGDVDLTEQGASSALGAVMHAEAFLDKIKSRIKAHVKTTGLPVRVGNQEYGFQTKQMSECDVRLALQSMVESGMTYEEMAKGVNISASSIKGLPKSYGPIKDYILSYCIHPTKVIESWGKLTQR